MVIAQMARNTSKIIVWEIMASIDLMTIHKTNFKLDIEHEISDVNGTFDSDGALFMAHSEGIWHVKIISIQNLHLL